MQSLGKVLLAAAALFSTAAPALAAPPASSADQVRPLLIGARPPALTLERADGSAFALADALATGPTIVIFYRGGW